MMDVEPDPEGKMGWDKIAILSTRSPVDDTVQVSSISMNTVEPGLFGVQGIGVNLRIMDRQWIYSWIEETWKSIE